MACSRLSRPLLRPLQARTRRFSSTQSSVQSPATSPFAPRHLLSIADLSPTELTALVRNAFAHKVAVKSGHADPQLAKSLAQQTIAIMFTKRSTRTRVSTEGAVVRLGGHPMFLGPNDIQLGVNESLYDTAVVVSSMSSGIVARVNAHEDVAALAKDSSVPVINALSDAYHPMQTLADYLTISEAFPSSTPAGQSAKADLGLQGLKIAWVGDANNVLFDLAIGAMKLGVHVSVATPKGYEIPAHMRQVILGSAPDSGPQGSLSETLVPEEAVKDADIIVTDTWVSMGQEEEKAKRLQDFAGFQVTADLAKRGGARENWKFMHCLPRHPEEVDDAVFYSPKSLVFQEAENRLWSAIGESSVDTTAASSKHAGTFVNSDPRQLPSRLL